MGRKLLEKAGLIGIQPAPVSASPSAEPSKPRTAPGTMMSFLSAQSSVMLEAEQFKERVKSLESSQPLRQLDPKAIGLSKWANRHEATFSTAEFAELKADIAASGGNVQPIKVRPKLVLNGSTPDPFAYELIYGHRRHRACQELGIPVLATVEEVDDQTLFEQMERENRGRKNLSAWEQGMMYRTALDEGLYPSLRRLAEALGVDVSLVSKGVTLARLPDLVIQAFSSPLEIQFRWAGELSDTMQRDPEGILARAKAISDAKEELRSVEVFARLTSGKTGTRKAAKSAVTVKSGGKVVALVKTDAKGREQVQFSAPLSKEKRDRLIVSLGQLFAD